MASMPNFFDDDDVPSFYDDQCQIIDVEGSEPSVLEYTDSSALMPGSDVTLTRLNTDESEQERNFFSLDFEIEGIGSCESNLIKTEFLPKEQANLNLQRHTTFGGESPMSWTASMSGSEPRSPTSSHSDDSGGDDLLEYLLKDSSIKVEPQLPKVLDLPTDLSNISSRTRQQRQTRSSSSRGQAHDDGNDATRGVSKQKGPWGNTKLRNTSKNAIMARENRQRKKAFIQNLIDANKELTDENVTLNKEAVAVQKKISSLEEEVKYLHKVLFNQSALAGLLKKVDQKEVRLNTSHLGDETEEGGSPSCSGGVCLHVNGTNATLKMCARCARDDQP
ncbi:CREB/ATF bZIP transcription factor-like [Asterias rubens]|uniref:CREB/ATF bZIP transcription factor-like n=1 Tax=Asterias rubens TaxID=7604 RepID=UPI00145550D1|nr:CREB/ATF bZIP transcription factor-like [Asterias rubens]